VAKPKKSFVIACVLIALTGAFSYFLRYSRVEPSRGPDFAQIPYQLGEWVGEEQRFADYTYDVLAADTTTYRVYRDSGGREMYLFIAYFRSQKYGGQIHSPRHCLPGSGWNIQTREHRELAVLDKKKIPVNLMTITQGQYNQFMWYWFQTRGGSNPSEYGLKLDLVFTSLLLRPTDAAFIRFNLLTEESLADTEQFGKDFGAALMPYLNQALPFDPAG